MLYNTRHESFARYLTPLAKAGYIAAVDAENLHSPQRKYHLAAKGRRLVS